MDKIQKMTRVFVARMLGSEPTWKAGDKVTFEFTYRYIRNKWQNGKPTMYNEIHCRRYPTMEQAFLHIVNHMNDNADIHDRYKTLDQWLNENDNDGWI